MEQNRPVVVSRYDLLRIIYANDLWVEFNHLRYADPVVVTGFLS